MWSNLDENIKTSGWAYLTKLWNTYMTMTWSGRKFPLCAQTPSTELEAQSALAMRPANVAKGQSRWRRGKDRGWESIEKECEKRIRETEAQAKLFVPSLLSSPSHHLNSWWSESVNGSWVLTIPTYICSLPLSCPKLLSGVVWNSFMLSWVMIMNFMSMIGRFLSIVK